MRSFLLVVFGSTLVLGITRSAHAQSITLVQEASLPRLDKEGKQISKRPQTLMPEGVSLQDCVDDQMIQFTLQMSGFEVNAAIQAWASIGQDCKPQTARGGGVQTCWRVYDSDIPLAAVTDVKIPVRKIMSGAPPFSPTAPNATEEACGQVNLSNINVQFIYMPPGQIAGSLSKDHTVVVDTVGPLPPSGLTVLPGDTRIQVKWNNISGGSAEGGAGGLTELTGVKVYCDVAGSAPATPADPICRQEPVEAGPDADPDAAVETVEVCEDGGTTAPSTGTGGACSSANFNPGDGSKVFPTTEFNKRFECGSITGNTGSSVTATAVGGQPLANGTSYAVAVASTDRFGNVGELSDVACMTPEPTTDFWNDYRRAGGAAGDGCSTGSGMPVGSTTAFGIGGAVVVSLLRRRAQRRGGSRR